MATYSVEYQQNPRRMIRDIKARDPLITTLDLTVKLSKEMAHSFDPRFIKRLSEKVAAQVLSETERSQIEERLYGIHENYRAVRQRLCDIIYWNPEEHPGERRPANKDVIGAAKNLVMLDLAVLSAEVANGLYKKTPQELGKVFQYDPIPPEVRTVVIAAWQRGGLLPAATVEKMVPVQVSALEAGPIRQEA